MHIDAFILVGGRSSRFGSNKGFAKLGGQTLADRGLNVLRQALPDSRVTLVAGNAAQFGIEAIVAGAPFIYDLYSNRGPLGGVHAALAHARTPWVFALACDYPFVSADLVQILAEKISDKFGAIVPEQEDGRLQPLCAFYNVDTALGVIEEILGLPRPTPPMHEVVAKLNTRVVRFNEYSHLKGAADLFININTKADLDLASQKTD